LPGPDYQRGVQWQDAAVRVGDLLARGVGCLGPVPAWECGAAQPPTHDAWWPRVACGCRCVGVVCGVWMQAHGCATMVQLQPV
jgi:hypothetical protein